MVACVAAALVAAAPVERLPETIHEAPSRTLERSAGGEAAGRGLLVLLRRGELGGVDAVVPPFSHPDPLPIKLGAGAQIDYEMALFGLPLRWRTRITEWRPGRSFVDEQESGPYAFWRHRHEFEARGSSTLVRDVVDYSVPLGPLGTVAHVLFVRRTLERIFDFRRSAVSRLLESSRPASLPTPTP